MQMHEREPSRSAATATSRAPSIGRGSARGNSRTASHKTQKEKSTHESRRQMMAKDYRPSGQVRKAGKTTRNCGPKTLTTQHVLAPPDKTPRIACNCQYA